MSGARQSPQGRIHELLLMAETADDIEAAYYRESAHEIEDALVDGDLDLAAALAASDHEQAERLRAAGGVR